jgi:hypothetical protein
VDVADLLVAAHLACRVIGFVRRHARLVPTVAAHTKSLNFKVLKINEFLHGRYTDPLVIASFMVITRRHTHKSK